MIKKILSENRFYLIAFIVIMVDQLVKLTVKFTMIMGDEIRVAGDWFKITYVENKGAAFGLTISDILSQIGLEISDETSKLILSLFSIFAVIVIIYLLRKVMHHKTPLPFFLALILGGALGNIVDRVFYGAWFAGMNNYDGALLHGRVVDMFHFDMGTVSLFGKTLDLWPVFNIADAAISVGIIALLLFQRRFFRNHEQQIKPNNVETGTENDNSTEINDSPTDTTPENQQKPEDSDQISEQEELKNS